MHFNDNSKQPTFEDPNYDKLYKSRSILNYLYQKFMFVAINEHLSIDKQMYSIKNKTSYETVYERQAP